MSNNTLNLNDDVRIVLLDQDKFKPDKMRPGDELTCTDPVVHMVQARSDLHDSGWSFVTFLFAATPSIDPNITSIATKMASEVGEYYNDNGEAISQITGEFFVTFYDIDDNGGEIVGAQRFSNYAEANKYMEECEAEDFVEFFTDIAISPSLPWDPLEKSRTSKGDRLMQVIANLGEALDL